MRVVLDTNVFISGIFFSGPPSQILKAWANKKFQLVLSQPILDEYQRVSEELSSKFFSIDISQILDFVMIHGLFVDTQGYSIAVCDDSDDDKFIECALAGNCEIIISGDKHLLKLSKYQGVAILAPRYFVDRHL